MVLTPFLTAVILTATQFDDLDHYLIIGSFILLVVFIILYFITRHHTH